MRGKVVMVTGATNGIGKETARELARMGATTIIVGRNPQKGRAVVSELQRDTGNPDIELMIADLSLQADIHPLAAQFKAKYDRLDVLVNNAGTMYQQREVTSEGIEQTWALNHLGYFLLTHLLLDTLKKSAPARIINVSSAGHYVGTIDFDDLYAQDSYQSFRQYNATKLANVLFTTELACQLLGTGVTVNAAHPGVIPTSFGMKDSLGSKLLMLLLSPISKTPQEGALTTLYLATSPEVEGVSGQYFDNCRPKAPSKAAQDEALARKLWEVSLQQVNLAPAAYDAPAVAVS